MPPRGELVSNKPLRGDELAKIIEADVHDVLSRDCMMTSRIAYGRVSYELRVILHMDNPAFKESQTVIASHRASDNQVEGQPELAALESSPPLAKPRTESIVCKNCHEDYEVHHADMCHSGVGPTAWEPISLDASYVSATQRDRIIDSPNVARIEHGLPISVVRQGRDTGGNPISVEEGVLYPPETVQDVVAPPVDHDLTRMVKQAFDDGSNLL